MATTKGSDGIVKIGTNTVAEVRSWSLEVSGTTIDDSELSDAWDTKVAGPQTWSGSIECYWDPSDSTGQGAMTIGATVTLNLYPEGAAVGDTYYTGSAIITGISREGARDGMVGATYSFEGTGALTTTTA